MSTSTVARTFRAAIKLGDDYITVEETVTLPISATDEEIAQAVDLGWRIYHAQRDALEAQVADLRPERSAPGTPAVPQVPPASDKQRAFIGSLQDERGWSSEQLLAFAHEHGVTDWANLTRSHASTLIDALRQPQPAPRPAAPQPQAQAPAQPARRPAAPQPQTPPARRPAPPVDPDDELPFWVPFSQGAGQP